MLSDTPIFTPEQVESINGYQTCGMWHPFTCGNNHSGRHHGERVLVATEYGMKCPTCEYAQDWCHGFMADGSWESQVNVSPMHRAILKAGKANPPT